MAKKSHRRPWRQKSMYDPTRLAAIRRMKCTKCKGLTTMGKSHLEKLKALNRVPKCHNCDGDLKPD